MEATVTAMAVQMATITSVRRRRNRHLVLLVATTWAPVTTVIRRAWSHCNLGEKEAAANESEPRAITHREELTPLLLRLLQVLPHQALAPLTEWWTLLCSGSIRMPSKASYCRAKHAKRDLGLSNEAGKRSSSKSCKLRGFSVVARPIAQINGGCISHGRARSSRFGRDGQGAGESPVMLEIALDSLFHFDTNTELMAHWHVPLLIYCMNIVAV